MDYACAKFGNFSFSCFSFIVWTNTHRDIQKYSFSITQQLCQGTIYILRFYKFISNLSYDINKQTKNINYLAELITKITKSRCSSYILKCIIYKQLHQLGWACQTGYSVVMWLKLYAQELLSGRKTTSFYSQPKRDLQPKHNTVNQQPKLTFITAACTLENCPHTDPQSTKWWQKVYRNSYLLPFSSEADPGP